MQTPGLLKVLYRMSLEHPAHWPFFIGMSGESSLMIEGLSINRIEAFVFGFRTAQRAHGTIDEEAKKFSAWMLARGHHPGEGWTRKFLVESGGDHHRAIQRYFDCVHAFLLEEKPDWFVELNRLPLPSQIVNGHGKPRSEDVRLPTHLEALGL